MSWCSELAPRLSMRIPNGSPIVVDRGHGPRLSQTFPLPGISTIDQANQDHYAPRFSGTFPISAPDREDRIPRFSETFSLSTPERAPRLSQTFPSPSPRLAPRLSQTFSGYPTSENPYALCENDLPAVLAINHMRGTEPRAHQIIHGPQAPDPFHVNACSKLSSLASRRSMKHGTMARGLSGMWVPRMPNAIRAARSGWVSL